MTDLNNSPSIAEATKIWAKIGLVSFGGPAAQISLMHEVVVEDKKWLKESQFLNALNFCMLLPGPEAMQLATYTGWRIHGVIGGLIAGLLFVLPGAAIILALAGIYSFYGELPLVQSLFLGIKAAVLVIVLKALMNVSSKALHSTVHLLIAGFAFVAIFFFKLPYPLIVLFAGMFGFFYANKSTSETSTLEQTHKVSTKETLQKIVSWLVIWWLPVAFIWLFDDTGFLSEIGLFFSKLAVVTFGGAYAVLAYMAQDVVEANQWLTAKQMVDALGLAETTPGPLILVTEFVGFISGFGKGGLGLGIVAALVTLWVTFVPCFLWIFAGAPYIELIAGQPKLRGALAAITAAVVGVILNLSIWFATHVLFAEHRALDTGYLHLNVPDLFSIDWRVLLLGVVSALLFLGLRWNMILVLAVSGLGGIALSYV